MGGLSSGPGPGICFLTLCLLLLAQQSQSAPVQEDNLSQQSRAQGYYDGGSSELSSGCYYNFQHYGEGDRIITNEPCLNCTCRNRMLMCYLRVCPFTKAIGQNCTIEKKPGQCCPLIICPEVPVQLLTSSTTTEHSESMSHKTQLGYGHHSTGVGHLDDYGCRINGEFYTNGAQIPGNIDKPCEVCYCIRNRTACIMQECTLQVDGCIPVYEEGLCCPVRYQCDYDYSYNAITTEEPRPTPGLVLTTTSGPFECQHDGKWYADGSSVDTEDPCEHCYCMKGDIVCAVQECKPPFEKDGHNCTAMPPAPGKCCPDSYHCDGNEIVAASETTFRQDRMHKFGRNNANVTMSITSSTSSTDKHHGWNYGTNANEKDKPNRFTDEQNKDGTTDEDEHMMITEGIPPTLGPLESGSHHLEGHYEGKPISEGHGVNTDNMLTISQVIQSIVHNHTQMLNQNRLNQSMAGSGKPQAGGAMQDDKIYFPVDKVEDGKRPPFHHMQTDEDGNPLESHSTVTELPEDYYGFTGGSSDIYAEHSGRPQTRPTKPSGGTGKPQPGQAIFGEHGHFGRPIKRPGTTAGSVSSGEATTDMPGYTGQPGKKPGMLPGTSVMTDEMGNPIETVTGLPEGFTGEPGTGLVYYDEHGRPHKRPIGHKRPGMTGSDEGVTEVNEVVTGVPEGFTGRPGSIGTYVYYDEHGRPHTRPAGHKQPGGSTTDDASSTGAPEGFTGQPGIFGEHGHSGRPIKKPVGQKHPGMSDETEVTGMYDGTTGYPEGFTGRPGVHGRPGMTGSDDEGAIGTGRPSSSHIRPHRPGVHMRPGMEDGMTEVYEGTTEISEGYTGQSFDTIYGEHGRPQKRPGMAETVTNKDGTVVEGVTKMPGHYDTSNIFGEHGHSGRPHKKPALGPDGVKVTTDKDGNVIDGMTETPEGHTGRPDGEVHYDENGQPITGVHKKPGQVMTDENGNPIESVTGSPEYHTGRPDSDGMEIIYDKYGRPHRRPVHKKPGMDAEGTTGGYGLEQGATETPGQTETPDFVIMYDNHGRPIKMPVHKTPGMHAEYMPTDKDGKPVEGVTELTEAHTGTPDSDDYVIFYDQFGRPHKMPVGHKRPGVQVLTDSNGKPLEGQYGITETPEGVTGTPDDNQYTIIYDSHGRPFKRPVHQKPGMDGEHTPTNKYGKPIYGMTETPESQTGAPGSDNMETVYDEHGQPIKPTTVHKKPGMHDEDDMTDEQTGTTETPEGTTETLYFMVVYDKNGKPIKKPIRKRPGMQGEHAPTDKYGQPVEGMTETPESHTGTPESDDDEVYYDKYGKPIKPSTVHKKPGMHGEDVMTDEDGKPLDEHEGTTETAEGQTETLDFMIVYDKNGRPIKKPIRKRPGMHGEPTGTDQYGKPVEGMTETPEGHTATPDSDDEVFYDKYGNPIRPTTVHKKPGMHGEDVMTDEDGKPLDEHEGMTETAESHTGKPDFMIVYDKNGRPIKKPIRKRPGMQGEHTQTDKYGQPVEGMTETPEGNTGTPDSDDDEVYYDKYGKPIKLTGVHKKPGMHGEDVMTDEDGNPLDEHTGTTETPESYTETLDFMIVYDKNGKPVKKPIRKRPGMHGEHAPTNKYGQPVEGMTETPESHTGTPESDDDEVYYDKYGKPIKPSTVHKKPGMHGEDVMTDEDGKPLDEHEGTTETAEGQTETLDFMIVYDKNGRPIKKPIRKRPGMHGEHAPTDKYGKPIEGMTETPESHTGTPDSDDDEVYYDKYGNPVRPTTVHKKPGMHGEDVMTDEDGNPLDEHTGTTETPEGHTGTPEFTIVYDPYGRPIKKPIKKRPGMHGEPTATDQYGKPVEGMTETPEGHTGTPENDVDEPVYDQYGRPVKRPVYTKPGMDDATTEKYGKPVGETPESQTGRPGLGETPELFGEHGRPHKKPVHGTKGPDGVKVTTEADGMTETAEGHTDRPDGEEHLDEHGHPIAGVHKKPSLDGMTTQTDEHGKPFEDHEIMTESPEIPVSKPESDSFVLVFDQYGRPHRRPVHKKPGSSGDILTDEEGNPLEGVTGTVPSFTDRPGFFGEHGHTGRPHKRPGMTGDDQPEEHEGTTGTPYDSMGEPGTHGKPEIYGEHGHTGRPHKRPVVQKKPGMTGEDVMDEDGNPIEGVTSNPEDDLISTYRPEEGQTLYGEPGRPHKRPTTQKRPGMKPGMTDEEGSTGIPHGVTETTADGVHPLFGEDGRPQKKPVLHTRPQGTHDAPGEETSTDDVYGTTETPDGYTSHPLFGEHGHTGRPHYKPTGQKHPGIHGVSSTEAPEGVTGTPGSEVPEIYYDEHGRPIKPTTVHKKPGMHDEDDMTDEQTGTTETPEGHTGTPDFMIVYDKNGRPIKKPIRKRPGMHGEHAQTDKYGQPVEGMTESPEGHTATPDSDDEVFYDKYGNPVRPTTVHKKPGMHGEDVMTDEDGNPLDEHTGTTETPEGHTGTPEFTIVYDPYGRPIKKPIKKRPGMHGEHAPTDKYGKPVEGMTETPESYTGKPESDDDEVYYDKYGKPIKPTTTHKKPGMDEEHTPTDQYGKPVEGTTGTPESDDENTVYDAHGNPIKRPIVHKKPGMHEDHEPTDQYGQPAEGTTATPEGQTETPDFVIMYDNHGRPIKMPVHKTPGMHAEYMPTDKDGKPVEGVTEQTEGHTGTPDSDDYVIYYDQFGRPHKMPVGHKRPGITDNTETPESDDEHGRPIKPTTVHKKPGMEDEQTATDKYGKPVEGMTEIPEGHTGSPDSDEPVYDQYGRPVKRPVYTKPGMDDATTDKYGKPVDETPESQTGRPGMGETPELFGEHGRPHKKPVHGTKGPEGVKVTTDEEGNVIDGMTEIPEGHTGRPDEEVHYDEHGQPIPGVHKKPGTHDEDEMTDEQTGTTETPEGHTGMPDFMIVYDKNGRPIKKPIRKRPGMQGEHTPTDKYGQPVVAMTETPESHTGTPDSDDEVFYDKYGNPVRPTTVHKKPGMQGEDVMTDEDGNPLDEHTGTTETPEGHTGMPDFMIVYDKNGRPIKKPIKKRPGMHGEHAPTDKYGQPVEGMTEMPEGHTGTPENDVDEPVYDQYGRPVKRPVYTKPGMDDATTDKYGKPVDETLESHTGAPGSVDMETVYDEHGQPIKPTTVHKKPGMHDEDDMTDEQTGTTETPEGTTETLYFMVVYDKNGKPIKKPIRKRPGMQGEHAPTDKYGQPVESMTETPESHTGTPESDDDEVYYDKYGKPIKLTGVHKKPGMHGEDVMTDEDGKPLDEHEGTTETAEGQTETLDFMIVYDKNGRPIKKPIRKRPGMHGEPTGTDQYGKPVEGMTETPEGHTATPDSDDEVFYDKYGNPIRPTTVHKKPGMHGEDVMTDEDGKPLDEHTGTTETPEGHTGTPEFTIVYDSYGRPIKKPIKKRPGMHGEPTATDQYGKPVEGMTETPEGHTGTPENDVDEPVYDQYGRPVKRPVYTKPGMDDATTDKFGKPVGETPESQTGRPGLGETPESQTGRPGLGETPELFGEHGRPHKKPVHGTKLPDGVKVTTEADGMTETAEGHTDRPDGEEHLDEDGYPIPGVHKQPGEVTTDDDGKPMPGMTDTVEGHISEPESDGSVTDDGEPQKKPTDEHGHPLEEGVSDASTVKPGVVYDEHGRPHGQPEDGHTTTDEHGHPVDEYEMVTMVTEEHPEQPESDSHHVMPEEHGHMKPEEKPDDEMGLTSRPHVVQKKPGVTGDDMMGPEETHDDHTGKPGDDNEPTIFGEHGHTGRPHTRPVKPGTVGSHDATETPEGDHTGSPIVFDEEGRPVVQKTPGTTVHGDDQEPHKDVEHESTVGHPGTTEAPEGLAPHAKPEDADEGTEVLAHKKPGTEDDHATESPEESSTAKPAPGFEIYFDETGRPHQRPIQVHPTSTDESDIYNEVPEGFTGKPDSGLFGEPGHTGRPHKRPVTKPGDDETHTEVPEGFTDRPDGTVVHYDDQGRPLKKPVTSDDGMVTEGPEKDSEAPSGVTEPQLFGEHGRPHKKPVIKPGSGVADDGDHTPGVEDHTGTHEEETTDKPDHDSPTLFGESGRPTKKPVKPVESHDEERPEVNEISEGDKVTELAEGEHVTGKPEGTKVAEPTHGTGADTDGSHPEEGSTTEHPEGLWQYLPPKKPVTHTEPEGTMAGKPHVKPTVHTPDGLTVPEEDDEDEDESLLITTDEPEEETEDVHGHPTAHEGEEPIGTKTKIPGESGKPHDEDHPTTPGLGSHSQDFTTSGYGTHDSSLPVTDGAVHGHPVTHGADGQPDLSHLGPDGVSFPGVNVVFDNEGKPHIIPGHHSEPTSGLSHPTVPVTTPGNEEEVSPDGEDGSHDTERPESVTDGADSRPEHASTPGVTIVFGEDGKPHIVPAQDTRPDVKDKPESTQPEEGSTLEGAATTVKTPSHGHFPGIPSGFLPSFSETGAPNTDAPIMIDGGLNEGSPFDAVLDSLANVLRPMQTTEKAAETTETHEEVPGEGSCFMDGVTYPNNSEVPPLNPCHTQCTCISSIIHCLSLKCPSPPEDVSHCTTVHDEKSCCPTYICDESSTSPVEGHEATTVSEDEHGSVVTEVPEDEDGQHTPIKTATQQGEMDKPSEGKPHDEEHPATTENETSQEPHGVTHHTKPEVDHAHPDDHVTGESTPGSMIPGPAGIEVPTEDGQVPTKTTDEQTSVKPEETTHVKPSRPHRPQSGYFPPSSDEHHPSTVLPSYFGTGKPITTLQEHQRPDSDDQVLGTDEPMTEDKKPGHEGTEESPMTTDDHKPHEGMDESQTPTKITGEEAAMPDSHLKPMEEPEQHHKPTTAEEDHPSTDEHRPETHKPDESVTSDDQTITDEESAMRPQESSPMGEETGDHTTYRPEVGAKPSEEHEDPHKKPSVHPTSMDDESAFTTTSPHDRPTGSEEPETGDEHPTSQSGVPGEEDTHEGASDKKPGHDSMTTDMPETGHVTSKIPVSHDIAGTPSGEDKDHEHVTTHRPDEQGAVDQFGKPTGQPEESRPGYDSTDKAHPSTEHPTDHSISEDEEHHKVPEGMTGEEVDHSTTSPDDKFATGTPMVPSGIFIDSQKKPEADEGHEPTHGMTERPHVHGESEAPHKKPDDSALPVDEHTAHTTMRPHGEPSEEMEGKPESSHPSSMDSASEPTTVGSHGKPTVGVDDTHKPQTGEQPTEDSVHTTGRPHEDVFEGQEPQTKPEADSHATSADEETGHSTTTRPHGEPTDAEQPHKRPSEHPSGMDEEYGQTTTRPHAHPSGVEESKPEDDLMYPSTKQPGTSGEPDVPQTDEHGVLHPTTEGVMVDGQPEHDYASTTRPRPGQVTHKPKPEVIPEEVLLHPTRTPGTFETQRPDMDPDHETTDHQPDEAVSTIIPDGFYRPVTKRPTIGGDKPEDSMTHRPATDKPEATPEGTGKPVHDVITEFPNFADIFGTFRPTPGHGQPGQKPDFGDFLPGTGIFQKPDLMKPDEDLGEHETPEDITPHEEYPSQYTTVMPGVKPGPWKRPIYSTNGTHFIQYVPVKEGEAPNVPHGAMLGEPEEGPDGDKYWPIIFVKPTPTTTEPTTETQKPTPHQIFNGTHFIQYVPFEDGEKPEVPEGATLGQPVKKPNGQVYWPIIDTKPLPSVSEDEPTTQGPFPGQVYNGTHFIQYLPYDEDKPEVPEGATLGQPQTAPNGEKYWPIISTKPLPDEEGTTTGSVESQPEQIFNGTHFIQYVPFKDGEAPEIPEEATLGQPQKGPDGQIYWPIINTKPIPVTPSEDESTTHVPPVQVFNGTNFIQYVPFKDGEAPEVPEGATLGQPQKTPDGEIYWPIIYAKPQPVKPEGSLPSQIFNGTHYIQYVPYEEDKKPEVPEGATLGQPQKTPDGQTFWPLIYSKPVTMKPEDEPVTTEEPFTTQLFNGTHYIQYIPFTEGFEPQLPEEATMGEPVTRPDGQKYWPIIYEKLPTTSKPEEVQPHLGQVYNGTHFIKYVPYRPNHKPEVPEEATVGEPVKGQDGQMYWPIVSTKPLPDLEEEPVKPQVFNGTHYIQYVPYEEEKPEVPEGAILGEPETRPDGQKYWPVVSKTPLPGVPITTQQTPLEDELPTTEPVTKQVFNGTHYIQYVPYKPGQRPVAPEGATLGKPTKGPNDQLYWPIVYQEPVPGLPVTTQSGLFEDAVPTQQGPLDDDLTTAEPVTEQVFNGTHYIQYVPYRPGQRPVIPEEATLGKPTRRPDNQLYWPIIRQKPVEGLPITTQEGPVEEATTAEPVTEQVYNGTHYIQYVPYKPGQRPVIPEEATLGNPTKGPNNQLYWPIVYRKPVPGLPITTQTEKYEDAETTTEPLSQYVFNGTHYIEYVPYKPGQRPVAPEGATLGKPTKGPNDEMYWPIIHQTTVPGLPTTTQGSTFDDDQPTTVVVSEQVFNGTHYIQYVPYRPGTRPVIPEDATLGNPTRRPDNQLYWPIIRQKPVEGLPITTQEGPVEEVTTAEPVTEQVYNGTHYIQYVPYKPGQRPVIPEDATLGKPTRRPDNQLYWPIIRQKPVEGLPITTQEGPVEDDVTTAEPVTEQVFNGTHYIQYVPYRPGTRPVIPEDATLGKPTRRPDNQLYWPIIRQKPVEGLPITTQEGPVEEVTTVEPVTEQVFNGTHYIQYVPYKPGQRPVIPEDATLGNPTRRPDNQVYWPIIRQKPVEGLPITTQEGPVEEVTTVEPVTEQVFNGTHYIQYVPYRPGTRPVIPEDATLGNPTRRPDNQLYWPIIRQKPVEGLPITTQSGPVEDDQPTTVTVTEQVFNGTHYIQYVPYRPGTRPVIPEDATLGNPTRRPDNQLYWPIIRQKPVEGLPITTQEGPVEEATTAEPVTEQVYNGTHYIQYVPYKPGQRPVIPEEATLGNPTKGPNNQLYWPIVYRKPVPGLPITTQTDQYEDMDATTEPITQQVFNGTHYIQYVPYKPGQQPVIPDDVILGKPTKGPDDQLYYPIISSTPFPGLPITTQAEIYEDMDTTTEPVTLQVFNGTHYIQYIPYKPGKRPVIPEGATLGKPTKGPNDEMYWPVIQTTPVSGLPVTTQEPFDGTTLADPTKAQLFNGTHYIQYVPYRPMIRPVVPTEAKLGKPTRGPNGQMYWPIIHPKPVPGIPIVMEKPFEEQTPEKGQYFNGTHYIQYVPYTQGHKPVVPDGATLGQPEVKSDGQKYWPIIRLRPAPGVPINWMPYEYTTPRPEQIFNGTHYIQYLPYNPTQMPEVPEGAVLGHPQKGPGDQMYWVLISDKPIPVQSFNGTHVVQYVTPVTPEHDGTDDHKPSKPLQVFNGTHYIQYVPYTPGQQPVVPEGAVLGSPTKSPEGETYWPIIYKKRPVGEVPSSPATPEDGQIFNGTHFIRYVPYKPSKRPIVPEGATISKPQRGPDGQKYWVISSKKPLPALEDEPVTVPPGQIYNGTHYIQYVPYNPSQMPQVPEGAVLGHPQKGPEGQMNWVIISDKPLPAQPGTQYVQYVTPVTPEDNKFSQGLTHNGTHYIQYVPYKQAQIPHIPNDATLGDLEQGPGGQMYWPIIFSKPPKGPIFNGTHYVTYTPQNTSHTDNSTKDHPFWNYGQYGGNKVQTSTTESYPAWSKPGHNATKPGYNEYEPGYKPDKRPGGEDSFEAIDEDHLIEYPSGSDYDESQEQPYGPGTCRYAGKVYVSAQQIPRDDPCDFCFCFRSDIICLQQSCPPPIPGCHEEPIQGFCCPRYECHVRMATLLNVTSTTTTTTTTLPPHFLSHAYNGAAGRTGCFVQGKAYRVGQAIPSASGPCMDCICGGDGKMKCEPKVCTPEPMVRQMMVSTEVTTTDNQS